MNEICTEYCPSKFPKWKGDDPVERIKDNPDR
jgi:hypothetical protein